MSRVELCNGDIVLLGRLNRGLLELGDIPVDTVERLVALGLARKVLGSCRITRAGQLSFHRQSFTRVSRRQRVARVTKRHPLFLHEARLRTPLSRARLSEFLKMRRALDAHLRRATRLPHWLMRFASETAGRFRPLHEAPADPSGVAPPKLIQERH